MCSSKIKLFVLIFAFALIFGEAISPIEAQEEMTSFESPKVLLSGQDESTRTVYITVTGYSSSYDEPDDDPWITASGSDTRDGIVASNFLPFGTKIRIPSLFGDKVFIVEDRMNRRHTERIDVWMPSKFDALLFGIHRKVPVEILE